MACTCISKRRVHSFKRIPYLLDTVEEGWKINIIKYIRKVVTMLEAQQEDVQDLVHVEEMT